MKKNTKEELNRTNTSSAQGLMDPVAVSDEQLLQSYREASDPTVFSELVSRYQRELYNYLRRFLGDATLAEDVFQATFFQVHQKRDSFEEGRKFRPWLYTIATNQAIDAQRRNRRHRRLSLNQPHQAGSESVGTLIDLVASEGGDPALAVESGEEGAWVRGEVEALPEPLRNAVNLVYFGGMKYRDAAKVMSVPVGTVKSRLHAAIQRLGQAWRDVQPASRS
ncbi:RNA polymerase sigma factor [Lacipirellula parvula]|uniref:RNA polymerase ECF-type sigma factor n=1 Tax=Lacipirellula parvula TaxID=2650471 RepID=A0A5K7XLQ6_9BACT|nr:RNA polymerase sigma factor [Lacipirellula parvula]BBO36291.1 RNA polymerase ECF-type sigma factor [Lacipirellula parvula]